MKAISSLIVTLVLALSGAAHAGDILLKEAESDFIVYTVMISGKRQDVQSLEHLHKDVRLGMISYRFAGRDYLTACRGVYSKNPITQLFNLNIVTGLRCVTQDGQFAVNYLKVN